MNLLRFSFNACSRIRLEKRASRFDERRAAISALPDDASPGSLALVCGHRPRPPVAPHARPVRDPRQRGDAAADAGRARRPALPRWLERWPTVDALAAASPADVIRRVAGPRLQPPRAQPPPRRPHRRRARLAGRPHRAARRRPLHGRRRRQLRLRRERAPVDTNVRRVQDVIYSDSILPSPHAMTVAGKWAKYRLNLRYANFQKFRSATGLYFPIGTTTSSETTSRCRSSAAGSTGTALERSGTTTR